MLLLEKLEQKKKYIILIMIACILIAIAYCFLEIDKKITSESVLMLIEVEERTEDDVTSKGNLDLTEKMISNFEEIITSDTSIMLLSDNIKDNMSISTIKNSITVKMNSNSDTFKIIVENNNSKLAQKINEELIEIFSEKIKTLYENTDIYIVDNPSIEENINYSLIVKVMIISIAAGLLINVIYIISLIQVDKKVKKSKDLESEFALKTIGNIPIAKNKLIGEHGKTSFDLAFKTLRSNIQFINVSNKGKNTILITSPRKSEGKTTVAANVAIAFANTGKKVILIDANMNNGKIDKIFNIPNDSGLSNYLSGIDANGAETNERINKFIKDTLVKNLNIITSGIVPPNSAELLSMPKFEETIKDLSVFYDVIILDGTPILNETDGLILTRIVNSTIIVSNYRKTKKDDLWHTKRDIQNVGGKIIGIVINKIKEKDPQKVTNMKKALKDKCVKFKDYVVAKRKEKKQKLLEAARIEEKQKISQELKYEESKFLEEVKKEDLENKKEENKVTNNNILTAVISNLKQIVKKEENLATENENKQDVVILDNSKNENLTSKNDTKRNNDSEVKQINQNKENELNNKLDKDASKLQNIPNNKQNTSLNNNVKEQPNREKQEKNQKSDSKIVENKENDKVDEKEQKAREIIVENFENNVNINNNIPNNKKVEVETIKEKIKTFGNKIKENTSNLTSSLKEKIKAEEKKIEEIYQKSKEKKIEEEKEKTAQEAIKESRELIRENTKQEEVKNIETVENKENVQNQYEIENLNIEKDENSVLVIVDAENGYCRAFSQYCFTEKLIRGIDKSDGFVKAHYSTTSLKRKRADIMAKYELSKNQVDRIDPLIYSVLKEYDENVWIERKMTSTKADEYVICMAKEYTRSESETKLNYDLRCQYLRKVELAKCQIEIEYKLDNLWNSNQINFTDKIVFYNLAQKYENLKEKRKAEQREKSSNKNTILSRPINLLKKIKVDEVKVKSVEELTREVSEIQKKENDYENYKFDDYENYSLKNNENNIDRNNNFNNNLNDNLSYDYNYDETSMFDTIDIEEQRQKQEEQEILLAQIRRKQEIKDKKAYEKARKKEEKNRKREEQRKNKEMKKQKAKEEARIEEELLGDNLYPKTKNNKNL